MKRPEYSESDSNDRNAFLSSRSDIIEKSSELDLWLKVIMKASDDLVVYQMKKDKGFVLTDEEEEDELNAISFLFNDDHLVWIDDYLVDICCQKCCFIKTHKMSVVSSNIYCCPKCNHKNSPKNIEYTFTENQDNKQISLKELLSILGINDVEVFRKLIKERMQRQLLMKRKIRDNRRQNERK